MVTVQFISTGLNRNLLSKIGVGHLVQGRPNEFTDVFLVLLP